MSGGMTRRGLLAGVGAVAAAGGAGWSWWRNQQAAEPALTDAAFWSLSFARPQGGELLMSELRGHAVLLNFWATWCPPCIKELPGLDRFHRTHGDRLQVIGLAVDTLAPVQEFLKKSPVGFAIGMAGMEGIDLARQLGNDAGVLPYTALFDASGHMVKHKIGETTYDELEIWAGQV
jgi:thiol-disulfide isomerase/thioredoxin